MNNKLLNPSIVFVLIVVFIGLSNSWSQSIPRIKFGFSNTADLVEKDENFQNILTWDVGAIFEDPDGHQLYYSAVSKHGVVNPYIEGNIAKVRSNQNLFGKDTVIVTCTDSIDGNAYFYIPFDIAEVAGNQAPVVNGSLGTMNRDQNFNNVYLVSLTQLFTDPNGDPMQFSAVSQNGVVNAVVENDTLKVSSILNQSGTDVITITANDGNGGITPTILNVNVTAIVGNQPPTFTGQFPTFVQPVNFPGIHAINLLQIAQDNDGDALVFTAVSKYGIVNARMNDDTLLYISNLTDKEGKDTINLTVSDGKGGIDYGIYEVIIGNATANRSPIVAQNFDKIEVLPNFSPDLTYDLTQYFSDPDDDQLVFESTIKNDLAAVSINQGVLTIASKTDLEGLDTIIITATDPDMESVSIEVEIEISDSPTNSLISDKITTSNYIFNLAQNGIVNIPSGITKLEAYDLQGGVLLKLDVYENQRVDLSSWNFNHKNVIIRLK